MNESRCSVCGMDLEFGRTRTRVLDAMRSRGHAPASCHPDGSLDQAERNWFAGGWPNPVVDVASGETMRTLP
jgi:hypothetical protein